MNQRLFGLIVLAMMWPANAHAMTWKEMVTPAWIQDNPDVIAVEVQEIKDGMLAFTVTLTLKKSDQHNSLVGYQFNSRLSRHRLSSTCVYLVSCIEVKDGARTVCKSDHPMFPRGNKCTFRFSIPCELIHTSTCTLSAGNAIDQAGQEPLPIPGSIFYDIRLAEFCCP